jgi:hypothetical protein
MSEKYGSCDRRFKSDDEISHFMMKDIGLKTFKGILSGIERRIYIGVKVLLLPGKKSLKIFKMKSKIPVSGH